MVEFILYQLNSEIIQRVLCTYVRTQVLNSLSLSLSPPPCLRKHVFMFLFGRSS